MVAFIDHYNAISANRIHSKPKSGKDLWYFNNSLLWKLKFSSRLIFYQKHKKNLFNLSEAKISLDVIIKSINFQSNESPGNYSLRTEFHKRFSNKLIKVMKKIL